MAAVEASWEEPEGTICEAMGRIENRSPSGVCLRLRRIVSVGAKIQIRRRGEEVWGIAKYCRREGMDYVAGIQRIYSARMVRVEPPTTWPQKAAMKERLQTEGEREPEIAPEAKPAKVRFVR